MDHLSLAQKIEEFRQLQLQRYRKRKGIVVTTPTPDVGFKIPDSLKIISVKVIIGVKFTEYLSSEDNIKIVLEKTESGHYSFDIRRQDHNDSLAAIEIKKNVVGTQIINVSPPKIWPLPPNQLSLEFDIWCYKLGICTIYKFVCHCSSDDRGAFDSFYNQFNQIVEGADEDTSDDDGDTNDVSE